jgi:hypothetical protein
VSCAGCLVGMPRGTGLHTFENGCRFEAEVKRDSAKKLIGMYAHRPFYLTAEEYEGLQKELMARALVGDTGLGDQILLRLLEDNEPRYHEARKS